MMLQQLARYAEREGLVTEPGFAAKDVRWVIPCGPSGQPSGVLIDLKSEANRKGRRFSKAPHLTLGEMKRGGSGTRHFLADALEVMIRLGGEDDPKVEAKHAFFVGLLRQAAEVMPMLGAVAAHLGDESVQAALRAEALRHKAKPTEVATISVDTVDEVLFPLEHETWHDWWRAFRLTLQPPPKKTRGKAQAAAEPTRMRCFMTGKRIEPAPTHPKVKGLASVGGISSGDVLASFKQDSFRSYGLVQSLNAALSEEAAVRYTSALTHLIRRGKRFQHAIVAYWYDGTPEINPVALIQGMDDEADHRVQMRRAKELLDAWDEGDPTAKKLGQTRFYAYTLSGASGRVMVRDVLDGPFHELLRSLATWFDDLAIVRRDGMGPAKLPKFFAVLAATVRELKEIPAPLESALWRAALCHTVPIPRDALARALARARIDAVDNRAPRPARYALIKAALNRSFDLGTVQGENHKVSEALNEDHPSPAYHCGRVMAVLAALQYSALGDVGAGVVQRYYAAASASPALVLGRLLRNAQFHLNKLEMPLRLWYEKKIAGILAHIEAQFPANLDLERQSLFALGYYQQQAHDRVKKTPAGEAIEQADPTATETSNQE